MKCEYCGTAYHKNCFTEVSHCTSCGAPYNPDLNQPVFLNGFDPYERNRIIRGVTVYQTTASTSTLNTLVYKMKDQ